METVPNVREEQNVPHGNLSGLRCVRCATLQLPGFARDAAIGLSAKSNGAGRTTERTDEEG